MKDKAAVYDQRTPKFKIWSQVCAWLCMNLA